MATAIQKANPHFSEEKLYQTARRLVIAEWQNIIFSEWLPIIIGPAAMEQYQLDVSRQQNRYDPYLNPSIINSFATAAFRFGHSLIQGAFDLVSKDGLRTSQFPLRDNYNDPDTTLYLKDNGETMVEIMKGLATQTSQAFDQHATQDITNHLFQPKGHNFGSDLIARNIQRGKGRRQ